LSREEQYAMLNEKIMAEIGAEGAIPQRKEMTVLPASMLEGQSGRKELPADTTGRLEVVVPYTGVDANRRTHQPMDTVILGLVTLREPRDARRLGTIVDHRAPADRPQDEPQHMIRFGLSRPDDEQPVDRDALLNELLGDKTEQTLEKHKIDPTTVQAIDFIVGVESPSKS
jgi:hypothetical protein